MQSQPSVLGRGTYRGRGGRRGRGSGPTTPQHKPSSDHANNNNKSESNNTSKNRRVLTLLDACLECIVANIKLYESFEGILDNGMLQKLISVLKLKNKISTQTLKLIMVPELEMLDLSGQFVAEGNIKKIAQQCPGLTSLNLSGSYSTITDTMVEFIARRCTKLKSLNISNCKYVSDISVQHLEKFCSELLSLNLNGNDLITDATLTYMLKCTQLRSLQICCSKVTKEALKQFAEKMPETTVISEFDSPIFFASAWEVPYGVFSIHSPHPIVLKQKNWPTTQHFFQAQKFSGTDYEEEIRNAESAAAAKRMGVTRGRHIRPDWDSIREEILLQALFAKFVQHADLKAFLLETDNRELIRHHHDPFWSDAFDGSGQNRQGKLLMKVRELLRNPDMERPDCLDGIV